MSSRNLSTVHQFSQKHPAFTEGGLRWMIFNSKVNGLDQAGAILRIGRKVLIDDDRFFACLDKQSGIQAAA